jgi:hypothetical protein
MADSKRILGLVVACFIFAVGGSLVAQQAHQITAPDRRQQVISREHWVMRGRQFPQENSATLRNRALQQKLRMRAALTLSNLAGTGGAWSLLGPRPLPSDASGVGLQDYGWVSGRATAVAIDPDDVSGNTVYAGGAYAGLWKSTNAGAVSPSASSVTWSALTDDQATLAIGAVAIQPQLSNPSSAWEAIPPRLRTPQRWTSPRCPARHSISQWESPPQVHLLQRELQPALILM